MPGKALRRALNRAAEIRDGGLSRNLPGGRLASSGSPATPAPGGRSRGCARSGSRPKSSSARRSGRSSAGPPPGKGLLRARVEAVDVFSSLRCGSCLWHRNEADYAADERPPSKAMTDGYGSAATVRGFRMQSLGRYLSQIGDRHRRTTALAVPNFLGAFGEGQVAGYTGRSLKKPWPTPMGRERWSAVVAS